MRIYGTFAVDSIAQPPTASCDNSQRQIPIFSRTLTNDLKVVLVLSIFLLFTDCLRHAYTLGRLLKHRTKPVVAFNTFHSAELFACEKCLRIV